jgi:hypothetical protein
MGRRREKNTEIINFQRVFREKVHKVDAFSNHGEEKKARGRELLIS